VKKVIPPKSVTALLEPFAALKLEQIHVPETAGEFAAAAADILAAGIAGFDTESKPTFQVGEISDGPHVVQFALADRAYLFQLFRPACRTALVMLLESPKLRKVGFGLSSDRGQIHAKLDVTMASLLDLGSLFRQDGYTSTVGARAAVAIVLNRQFHKSKKTTTSNWAQQKLSASQMLYAANDAYAALMVHEALRAHLPVANG
jgi:ribonuclease D